MLTNKRQIKKYINRISEDVATVVLPAAVYTKAVTEAEAHKILEEVSTLQQQALSRLSIAFDKAPDAFDSMRAYHAAHRSYYRNAYEKAISDFEKGVQDLIAPINKKIEKK